MTKRENYKLNHKIIYVLRWNNHIIIWNLGDFKMQLSDPYKILNWTLSSGHEEKNSLAALSEQTHTVDTEMPVYGEN